MIEPKPTVQVSPCCLAFPEWRAFGDRDGLRGFLCTACGRVLDHAYTQRNTRERPPAGR